MKKASKPFGKKAPPFVKKARGGEMDSINSHQVLARTGKAPTAEETGAAGKPTTNW